ncbi:Ger(x)C family spore germination protein [Cytobacillus sp. FJAT-53684]|uniref:Ger(X)C family spore germination protein n=1 Tax=Cytobacillus mangrovibacter TaxID=3299024 RepID=A0ABW6JXR2_9BACI
MIYRFTLSLIALFLLSGCVPKSIIDDVYIQSAAAIDEYEENKLIATVLVQNYLPDQAVENIRFTSTGILRRSLLTDIQKQSPEPIVVGGLMVTIFGDKLADKGISEYIDALQRDPSIGTRNYLVTSSGSALEILEGEYGVRGNATFLRDLIEQNIEERDVPDTNLHIFLRDYYAEGRDPYLPEIKRLSKDRVEISGISIFNEDKEIDILPKKKMFFFKLLTDKYSNGFFLVKLDNGTHAYVRSIRSKHKIKYIKKDPLQVDIHIDIKGVVQEYTGKKVTEKTIKDIKEELEKKVEKECLELVKQFQEQGVDPVGFGSIYKQTYRGNAHLKNWKDQHYKNLSFKINVNVKIDETGVIE